MEPIRIKQLCCIGLSCLVLWTGCERSASIDPDQDIVNDLEVVLDPSGYAPLTARLTLSTDREAAVEIRVQGRHGEASDVVKRFPDFGTRFELPVLGLYGDHLNQVELRFFDANDDLIDTQLVQIQTDSLIPDLPAIEVHVRHEAAMTPGFTLVNYFGFAQWSRPNRAFMFDAYGDIRWYLNYKSHPDLNDLFYDNGLIRLANGNFIFGNADTDALYEIDMLGAVINTWSLQGYGFHHAIIEKPNGNLVVTVNDNNKPTVEDVIIELDRNSGDIVNTWDLNRSLDYQRRSWPTDLADLEVDWFHANGLAYSEADDCLIVSGRTQGTVKLTADNQVVWILAPHRGWTTSGEGADLNAYLLQPLDISGTPITDAQVLDGAINHPDFEWAWYQHSPLMLPNGNLMLFDNGDNRNYRQPGTYSRAVEYEIDEENLTVRQVWAYGKGRGANTYSRVVSKVWYHPEKGNVLFVPGGVHLPNDLYAKVIEVNQARERVVFEATLRPPRPLFILTCHSAQRLPLYPAK